MLCKYVYVTKVVFLMVHSFTFGKKQCFAYLYAGEMAERSNAAVLKTVEAKVSGGSNPSLSAGIVLKPFFVIQKRVFSLLIIS